VAEKAPGTGVALGTALPVFLLLLTLLALALVPVYMDRRISRAEAQVERYVEPAVPLAVRMESFQVQQMAALRGFLLSGEGAYREAYRRARAREDEARGALSTLIQGMPSEIRIEALGAALEMNYESSVRWHQSVQEVLNEEISRAAFLREMDRKEEIYRESVAASRNLAETVIQGAEAERDRIDALRSLETRVTLGLVALGLVATLLVFFLGWRLWSLVRESEARRQEALRARREADALLRATGDGVVGMDLDGRCTFLNRAAVELLGYPARLAQGRDVHELLHHSRPDGTSYPRSACPILRALNEGRALSAVNETLWNADGTPFPVQVSVRALREGRDLQGAVLTFTDMTKTRAAEASLRRALRTRDEVLAVVSHDLLNPVSTIYSTAGFLLDLELPRDKAREHLVAIKRSARRMNRLIQDLLDVARMEGGRLPVSVETFSLADVVEEAVRIHEARGKEKSVELTTRLPEEEVTLSADRDRILQVLSNLLDNALRFSPPEREVEVGGRMVDRRQVVLWVSDQGPGISPEDQARLFDRFWQVKRRDRKGGAGLGLSIVKGLVEAHGGRVWVESREGKGATFFFSLPLLLPGSSSGKEATPPRSS